MTLLNVRLFFFFSYIGMEAQLRVLTGLLEDQGLGLSLPVILGPGDLRFFSGLRGIHARIVMQTDVDTHENKQTGQQNPNTWVSFSRRL